ncbi:MAG: PAS domain-containing protein [Kiritimatiellia bacterium]
MFRQFLASMYDAVVITDPNGHILEINLRTEEHFGYTQEELIDQPISFCIPGLAPTIVQRIRKGLEEGHHMLIDANGLNKAGVKFACEVAVSIVDLIDPGDLVFTVRNVERRRRVRDMLRAKENAFQISQAALFACDSEGRFTQVNDAFLQMFGLANEEEACEHVFADFMSDDPLPENFRKALAGESSTIGIVAETEDGADEDEIEISLAPNRDGRKIKGVVGSVIRV